MERHIQADNAFMEWMEAMSKNVVHIADAWYAAVQWADAHPDIDVRTMAAWRGGYKEAIEKACEWLKENMPNKFEDVQNYVDNFRKAMKGGQL